MVSFFEELAVGVGFFVYWERVGAGCGGHPPKVDGPIAYFYFYVASDFRDGAVEGAADDFGGLLAGCYYRVAEGDLLQ